MSGSGGIDGNSGEAQWHHPVSVSMNASHTKSRATVTSALAVSTTSTSTPSSSTTTSFAAISSSTKSINTTTNMPFRDLLLHSKYSLEAKITTNNTENNSISNDVISSGDEQERLVLATHFHERDRLILQHQRQQLQQKQRNNQVDLDNAFVGSSDRIRDFVIGGGNSGIDRSINKSPGKYEEHKRIINNETFLLFFFGRASI